MTGADGFPIAGASVDGFSWYLFAPSLMHEDGRVATSIVVVFVKARPGWQSGYGDVCLNTGLHVILARDNLTQLAVPCDWNQPWCRPDAGSQPDPTDNGAPSPPSTFGGRL